jgi:general secretion pathway protein L
VSTLRVQLCPLAELGAESVLDFEVLDAARTVLERGAAVPAALPVLARTELVVAGRDVLLLTAVLPKVSGARLRAALPALAEPMLLGELERNLVVAGRPDAERRATLAVVDRALLRRALDLFARLGIRPASATPEPLALPAVAGRWRLRKRGGAAVLRMGRELGISCAATEAPPVELELALAQAPVRPEAIEVDGPCDAAAWTAALGVPVLEAARETRAPPVDLELLQYDFAPRLADWRAWRPAAALAAALAVVWIAGLNVDAWLMLREERELRGRMSAALREAFPRVPVVLDAPAQMRRGLADLRAAAGTGDAEDFLPLAAGFARLVESEAEAVRSLEYRDRALQVRFDPRAVDSADKRNAILERLARGGLAGSFASSTLSVRKRSAT